jgi:hypothetical protein
MPWPKKGLDLDIDDLLEKITRAKNELKDYLGEVRKKSGCPKVSFAHNHKYVSYSLA